MSARETIRNVLLVHYASSPNPTLTADTLMANAHREGQEDILVVSRFDTAIEPAPEEEPLLTVGAIAEDGRPVGLLFDEETRRKVAGWLAPAAGDGQAYDGELDMLHGLVATLNAVAEHGDLSDVRKLLREYATDDAEAREQSSREADVAEAGDSDA